MRAGKRRGCLRLGSSKARHSQNIIICAAHPHLFCAHQQPKQIVHQPASSWEPGGWEAGKLIHRRLHVMSIGSAKAVQDCSCCIQIPFLGRKGAATMASPDNKDVLDVHFVLMPEGLNALAVRQGRQQGSRAHCMNELHLFR